MKNYEVVGVMSGTSLDGLDIAHVRFYYDIKWSFKLLNCTSIAYKKELRKKLRQAYVLNGLELKALDKYFGKWIGQMVKVFIDVHKISPELVVSHGHTVFHQPEKGLTLQIGDGYQIALASGIKTVCDLRSMDMALGGQGAPLVPVGDKMLFETYDLCLNLGGFSNISFDIAQKRIAYDICPVNTVLNKLASKRNLDYDRGGALARSGEMNTGLLSKLNYLNYYAQKPPKSLGIEWVQKNILPLLEADSIENMLNTFCHHIAYQINAAIEKDFGGGNTSVTSKMLVTGGGAKNDFLVELIKKTIHKKVEIVVPDDWLIDFKEAIIFGFLGLLRVLGKYNVFKSVTGAKSDSSSGLIFHHSP